MIITNNNYKEITFIQPTKSRDPVILNAIRSRRKRKNVISTAVHFTPGDIIAVSFWKRSYIYRFEGICMRIRKKSLLNSDASFTLRNILFGIGIEATISYYYNRVYELYALDYKRKKFVYKRSKLYYLRTKMNRASRVK